MRAIALAVALVVLLPTTAQARRGLPLGLAGVRESRTTDRLAPGVTYTRIERGHLSTADGWAVDVAVVGARADADALTARLAAAGFEAEV
jgi:hypothetical protein